MGLRGEKHVHPLSEVLILIVCTGEGGILDSRFSTEVLRETEDVQIPGGLSVFFYPGIRNSNLRLSESAMSVVIVTSSACHRNNLRCINSPQNMDDNYCGGACMSPRCCIKYEFFKVIIRRVGILAYIVQVDNLDTLASISDTARYLV